MTQSSDIDVPPTKPAKITRVDVIILSAVTLGLFIELFASSMGRQRALMTTYDMAYFRQAAWYISHGDNPFVTLRGLYLLADHANFIFFPIGWLSALVPSAPLLLGVQAIALSSAVIPLYLLGRFVAALSIPLCTGVVIAYTLFPAMHNINMYDFHPEVIAIPAFVGALYFALTDRWWRYAACIALALLCREDMAVPAMVLGAVLALTPLRSTWTRRRRAGAITIVGALAVLVVDVFIVMPHFANGQYVQGNRFGKYGDHLLTALVNIAIHPRTVFYDLTVNVNITTVIALFAPLLFLPWLKPRWLLPGIPLQFLYLLSTVGVAHTIDAQYTVAIIPFLFVAMVMALGDGKWPQTRIAILLSIAGVLFFYNLAQDARIYLDDDSSYHRTPAYRAVLAATKLVGKNDSVSGSLRVWQAIPERAELYNFPMPWNDYAPPEDPVPLAKREQGVKWIIVDEVDRGQWAPDWTPKLEAHVAAWGYTKVFDRDGVVAYSK